MHLDDDITEVKGIGDKKSKYLKKIGISTVKDMHLLFPRTYLDRRKITDLNDVHDKEPLLIKAVVTGVKKGVKRGKSVTPSFVYADDGTGRLEAVYFNSDYIVNTFRAGKEYYFYGKCVDAGMKIKMQQPETAPADDDTFTGIIPVYPLTSGISQKEMRKWQRNIMENVSDIEEYLPQDIIERNNMCSIEYAFHNIHFPENANALKYARYRLVFDELLMLQTGIIYAGTGTENEGKGIAFDSSVNMHDFTSSFPYSLTKAQEKVIDEIKCDMESNNIMKRLVQGDVGSGKTAIAEAAMYKAVKSGFQAVMMAPTEILARQHFDSLTKDFGPFGIKTGFLSGSIKKSERRETLEKIKSGEISIIIGTHALIQPDVEFSNLGLVITDEQHRFGVRQRELLNRKGNSPDLLVMTATPIPRTLAVILYGDLDISVIDELPPGRKEILTKAVTQHKREAAYDFLEHEIKKGRQGYVVASLIEDNEGLDLRSAESLFEEIKKRFSGFSTALIHGGMKQKEKDAIMQDFADGKTDILVSTVVIEVGINVPNASIMIIENAERFGLAQLHQLRGRVGRGEHQSYCILITDAKSDIAKERARIMTETSSGFVIAEKDLELRGPGDFFGTRQHGLPQLRIADLVKHINMLDTVKKETMKILEEDPYLKNDKYRKLTRKIKEMFNVSEDINI